VGDGNGRADRAWAGALGFDRGVSAWWDVAEGCAFPEVGSAGGVGEQGAERGRTNPSSAYIYIKKTVAATQRSSRG
jgi:hypothetical protein